MLNEQLVFQQATETLFTILQNVLQNPDEPKYRNVRRSTKAFQEKLAHAKGAVRFLRAAGFVEQHAGTDDAAFVLDEPAPSQLNEAKTTLKAVVKHRFALDLKAKEEARQQENAAAAGKLAQLKEVSKQNQAKQTELDSVERQRLLEGIQIDREDKVRQADPMQWK